MRIYYPVHWFTRRRPFSSSPTAPASRSQMLGHSLLTQFEGVEFHQVTLPFVDSAERPKTAWRASTAGQQNGQPIVFSTLVNNEVRTCPAPRQGLVHRFLRKLHRSARGRARDQVEPYASGARTARRTRRSTAPDRGDQLRAGARRRAVDREPSQADVILVGVSPQRQNADRLYLAMQLGVKAANYPLIPEDFERHGFLGAGADKAECFGLTIDPERLHRDPQRAPAEQQVRRPRQLPLRGRRGRELMRAKACLASTRRTSRSRRSRPHPARAAHQPPDLLKDS